MKAPGVNWSCENTLQKSSSSDNRNQITLKTADDLFLRKDKLCHTYFFENVYLLQANQGKLRTGWRSGDTTQKMKFSITDFLSKCDQIRSFLQIRSHLLKKSVMKNFIFCAVNLKKWLFDFCLTLIVML